MSITDALKLPPKEPNAKFQQFEDYLVDNELIGLHLNISAQNPWLMISSW